MTFRPASVAAIAIGLSITCGAVAEPREGRGSADELAAAAKETPKDAKQALRKLVNKHAEASGLARELQGYSLSPHLVQLRRYAEPGQKGIKVVCIVSIALKDSSDVLVAEVRGTASALDGSSLAALDAASYAAVMRVPSALAKLRGPRDSEIARR